MSGLDAGGVTVTEVRGVRVVAVGAGDLTAAEAPAARAALEEHAEDGGFVLDLGGVRFMDSAGIGVVVGLQKLLMRRGDDLRLARPSRDVSAAFELVRLHRLLEIHATVDDAVEAFGADGR